MRISDWSSDVFSSDLSDAAPDGVRKINQARKAWKLGSDAGDDIPSFSFFTGAEMDELMGQNAFIHACALAGQAGEGVVKRATMLERYRGVGQSGADGVAGRPEQCRGHNIGKGWCRDSSWQDWLCLGVSGCCKKNKKKNTE